MFTDISYQLTHREIGSAVEEKFRSLINIILGDEITHIAQIYNNKNVFLGAELYFKLFKPTNCISTNQTSWGRLSSVADFVGPMRTLPQFAQYITASDESFWSKASRSWWGATSTYENLLDLFPRLSVKHNKQGSLIQASRLTLHWFFRLPKILIGQPKFKTAWNVIDYW